MHVQVTGMVVDNMHDVSKFTFGDMSYNSNGIMSCTQFSKPCFTMVQSFEKIQWTPAIPATLGHEQIGWISEVAGSQGYLINPAT